MGGQTEETTVIQITQAEHEEFLKAKAEADRLTALINNPHTNDFLESVRIEATHQVERWGEAHDRSKSSENWFWLVGYLAGKALRATIEERFPRYQHVKRGTTYEVISIGEDENNRGVNLVLYRGEDDGKIWVRPAEQFFDGRFVELPRKPSELALHHTISSAAALLHWHAAIKRDLTGTGKGEDADLQQIEQEVMA